MSDAPTVAELAALPHFRGLAPDLLEKIAAASRAREYRSGESIFLQGEPARAFHVVRAGGVRIFRLSPDGREQVLHHCGPGRSFAEAALLSIGRYPAHAQATETPTVIVEIGGKPFLELFRSDPRLSAAMVGSLCMWLHELVERVEELSIARAGARLARYLLRQPASGAGPAVEIELSLARRELAAHLAIQPETLSRLLRRWQDEGVIAADGRRLTIPDPRALEAIAAREEGP